MQREITDVANPARALVTEIQLALAREAAGARGYVITHGERYADAHLAARAMRVRAYDQLLPLTRQLGDSVNALAVGMGERLRPTDAFIDSLFSGEASPTLYTRRLDDQQARFLVVTADAARIDHFIGEMITARTAQIRATARVGAALMVLLVLLALLAALLVASLGRRYRAQRENAERVTESRARLMRGFSHDVKNPLGAADGYLQLMEDGLMDPLQPRQAEAVGNVRRLIAAALRLIEDLLELARSESGELEIAHVPTDVAAVAKASADEYAVPAAARGLRLSFEVRGNLPAIDSDARRIRQVLGNLFSNAVKYTVRGSISGVAELRERGNAPGAGPWIAVDVSDTGPGIASAELPLLFQEYQRLEPSAARGTGIGLAIAQRIARALGGEITVLREVGRGSTFTLWLPVRQEAKH
jgi:signal transduction histidine kinase